MGWIIDYIRSCFCKHEYDLVEHAVIYDFFDIRKQLPIGERMTYICKKCGRVKKVKTY